MKTPRSSRAWIVQLVVAKWDRKFQAPQAGAIHGALYFRTKREALDFVRFACEKRPDYAMLSWDSKRRPNA